MLKPSLAVILAVALALRVAFIIRYWDLDWEVDCYNHIIIAKAVFQNGTEGLWLMISIWGKMLYTTFFALLYLLIPDAWPLVPVTQITNSVLWIAAVALTIAAAKRLSLNRPALLFVALTGAFSFISFRASVTGNTEPMGALVFAAALYFWTADRTRLACFAFGCVPLVRMDAGFCVAICALFLILDRWWTNWSDVREYFYRGLIFSSPLLFWNALGFIHTGQPLYVLTGGYPNAVGFFGFGSMSEYVQGLLVFDAVLFVPFWLAIIILIVRRDAQRPIVGLTVAMVAYIGVLSVLRTFGIFATGGLLRYFVFLYPGVMIVAAYGVDQITRRYQRREFAAVGAIVICLGLGWQLRWLVQDVAWHHSQYTRVPVSNIPKIRAAIAPFVPATIYTDRADVLYYLGLDSLYGHRNPLSAARDPSKRGVFIVAEGWSKVYNGVEEATFAPAKPDALIVDWQTTRFAVFVRR